jgi:hypothetical protein
MTAKDMAILLNQLRRTQWRPGPHGIPTTVVIWADLGQLTGC